ncbi:CDP-glycerol glycerophosphotransferase family protein, partial [Nocardioides sp.]|uniref:CDP-glycerol glycerophosphotransferase family protein n=1 Tax=Nocardioides sp. TaxID=35761 RepID=UPI002735B99A
EHDPWGLGAAPLPPGPLRLDLPMSEALVAATPSVRLTHTYRMRVRRADDGTVALELGPPLAGDEVGAHAQQRHQVQHAVAAPAVDPGLVHFQSYTGQANDSPLAIHEAMRRLRPGLRSVWAVADRSVPVPEGAEPVLLRSREWYAALATAGHVVTNIDLEPWFVKRPGQRVLQTYHGHPSKAMGLMAWEAKGFTPLRVEEMLDRTARTWDLLVAPSPAAEALYRQQFAYDGAVVSAGYPRNDELVAADRHERRRASRERLGIGASQRAVLYAPTWRDDLASNHRVAPMAALFDVEAAAAALGDDHVILLRGHRFHRRRSVGSGGARVLDVTDHPHINDLILAADAAVLDYSSLRFDIALAGCPMVFLVPDLARYAGSVRGFLHDFAGTAPGPLVDTTAEVVDLLRDLDGLAAAYSPARERFVGEFWAEQDDRSAERVVAAFWPAPSG